MTDINKLKELAVRALPFAPGEWFVENGIDQVRDCANDFVCETGEDEPIKASFIAAANPQAILGLLERLRLTELKGLMDAQSNMDLIKDIGRLKSQNDLMLNAIVKSRTALMVGRPTSKVAGQKYTEAFAAIVAALEGATK
ncbi:TPA: hypothetical protein L4R51_002363 [Pseudomonas aeruginosa]|nr:hypothetical protein [Pseudomonas aeruginosa]